VKVRARYYARVKKKLILLSLLILCSVGFGIFHKFNKAKEFSLNQNSRNDFERYIDAGYFLQSASLSSLEETYLHPEKKLRILLVPGHTNDSPGAIYKDSKEVDFTFELTEQLYKSFLKEGWADVEIASLRNEDVNGFRSFFIEKGSDIEAFEKYQKGISEELRNRLLVEEMEEDNHVTAKRDIAELLYGINHYANKNDFDIVLHIHFNDYPRSDINEAGVFSGYALYVPDSIFSNSEVSLEIANSIAQELAVNYATSSHPLENKGVIESKELIAVGAHNTARTPAIVIEYAYIYEPFLHSVISRQEVFETMVDATIEGIRKSLE